jgi:hypothetical protein
MVVEQTLCQLPQGGRFISEYEPAIAVHDHDAVDQPSAHLQIHKSS